MIFPVQLAEKHLEKNQDLHIINAITAEPKDFKEIIGLNQSVSNLSLCILQDKNSPRKSTATLNLLYGLLSVTYIFCISI